MSETIFEINETQTIIESEAFQHIPVAVANPETVLNLAVQLDTIQALRDLNTSGLANGTVREVKGYYAAYDTDIPHKFFWNPAETAADNGFSILQPTAGGVGRWVYPVGNMPFPLSAAGAQLGVDATPILSAVLASGAQAIIDKAFTFNTNTTISSGQTVIVRQGITPVGTAQITNDGTIIYLQSLWSGFVQGDGAFLDLAGAGTIVPGFPDFSQGGSAAFYQDTDTQEIRIGFLNGSSVLLATPSVFTVSPAFGLIPSPWDWTPTFDITYANTNYSYANPVSGTTYFVATDGDDATLDGTNSLTPYRTITAAMAATGTDLIIRIQPGVYYQTDWAAGTGTSARLTDNKNIALIGDGAVPSQVTLTSSPSSISWTDNLDGTYTATISDVFGVVDMAQFFENVFLALDEASSLADVQSGADNRFFADATTVTIKLGRTPDSDILAHVSDYGELNNFRVYDCLVSNLTLSGLGFNTQVTGDPGRETTHILDDVNVVNSVDDGLKYTSANTGGWIANVYQRNVKVVSSKNDGFNYNNATRALEECCIAVKAGFFNPGPNQGSTGHNGARTIRVKCRYEDSAQQNAADVTGALGWYINCQLINNGSQTNISTADTAWLDTCTLTPGSGLSNFSATGQFFLRNTDGEGANISSY